MKGTYQEGITDDPSRVSRSRLDVTPETEIKNTPEAELALVIYRTKVHVVGINGP
jgi:hypothetical protein